MAAGVRYARRRAGLRGGERGVVLVLAIFAVVLLLVLSVGLTAAVRGELAAASTSLERSQSYFLAEAGITEARALLLYEDASVDSLQDVWGSQSQQPLDNPEALGPGYLRVQVSDACGRVDLNAPTTTFQILTQLTGDPAIAQSIIDWRGSGQEASYYRALPYPYVPRQGRFQTTGELLLVKGMTPDLYYGTSGRPGLKDLTTVMSTSSNTTADGKPRISLNVLEGYPDMPDFAQRIVNKCGGVVTLADANKLARGLDRLRAVSGGRSGYTSLGQLVQAAEFYQPEDLARIIDYFAINTNSTISGKVNVNTAPVEVLAALPGSSSAFANAVVQQRDTAPFTSLGAVVRAMCSAGGLPTFVAMADYVTTKSSCFVIDSMGYTGTGRGFRRLCALVQRTSTQVNILHQWEENVPLPPPQQEIAMADESRRLHRVLS